jgi:hypothetical protein
MAEDFFDADLVEETPILPTADSRAPRVVPISGAGQMRMKRQKEEMTTQAADAIREIEELRAKQERLEKERNDLQELARKQESYEESKADVMARLAESLVHLERDEAQANRFAELLSVMRHRFKDTLDELRGINESAWAKEAFATELNKALVLVEEARSVYRKGMAKIDAENWSQIKAGAVQPAVLARGEIPGGVPRRFGFWMKAGLAFTIPLIVLVLLVFAAMVVLRMKGWY